MADGDFITIQGLPGKYRVSPEFFTMSPEDQQKVVTEITNTVFPEPSTTSIPGAINYADRAGGQYASGVSEGLADIAGAPVDALNWLLNKAESGVESLTGYRPPLGGTEQPLGGSETFRALLGSEDAEVLGRANPLAENYGIQPADPHFETARQWGRYTGQGAAALATAGAAAPLATGAGVVPTTVRMAGQGVRQSPGAALAAETVAAKTAQIGEEAGADAGQNLGYMVAEATGGDPEAYGQAGRNVGRTVGGIAGGVSPAVITGTLQAGTQAALSRKPGVEQIASGPQAYAAAERSGVRPTYGLVGNEMARRMENVSGYVPIVGTPVQSTQGRQVTTLGEALADIALGRRPAAAAAQTQPAEIGENIRTIAGSGAERARATVSRANEALEQTIGTRAAVPVRATRQQVERMIQATDVELGGHLQTKLQQLEQMRTEPIDVALHQQLERRWQGIQRRIATVQQRRQAGQPVDPDVIDQINTDLQDVTQKMDANLGVPFERLRDWRTNIGKRTDGGPTLSEGQMKQVYDVVTGDMERMAQRQGNLQQFRDTMETTRRLSTRNKKTPLTEGRDIPYLTEVSELEPGPAYNRIVTGGMQNWGRLDVLRRQATPEEWGQLSGDIIERLGTAGPGQQGATGDVFSPNTFLTNWNKLSRQSKELLLPTVDPNTGRYVLDDAGQIVPDTQALRQLDDIATVAESMRQRALAGNPSGTAPAAAMIGTGSTALLSPLRVAGSLAGLGALIRTTLSDAFARTVAGVSPSFQERVIARLPGQTARTGMAVGEQ